MSNSDREPNEHECFPDCGCDIQSHAQKKCEHDTKNRRWTGLLSDGSVITYWKSDYPECPICPAPLPQKDDVTLHTKSFDSGLHQEENYEMFCDPNYYDMWCVRNNNDKRFDSPMSFHFMTKQEAETFKRLIEVAK